MPSSGTKGSQGKGDRAVCKAADTQFNSAAGLQFFDKAGWIWSGDRVGLKSRRDRSTR